MPKELKVFSRAEVEKHNTAGDLWITIDNRVYDVSKFGKLHPGGATIFLNVAGEKKDATKAFYSFHKNEVLEKYYGKLCIGTIEGSEKQKHIWEPKSSYIGKMDLTTAKWNDLIKHPSLSKAPYGEASWVKDYYKSKYYDESHLRYRLGCREFYQNLTEEAEDCEESNDYVSKEVYQKMGQEGILVSKIGVLAMPYAKKFGIKLPGGIKPEEFNFHHELIQHEEQGRLGVPGYSDGMHAGFSIGLPPIINFYHGQDKEQIIKDLLLGEKRVCLAITGPEAGSDVANHTCIATKSADGTHYVVRGLKKWITGGCNADYFVTAVRTGGKGIKGQSLLLIKREDGLQTKQMSTSYSKSAATALIIFDDIKVPCDRLMGITNPAKEGQGFQCIMLNFNHERWMIAACIMGFARLVVKDCALWLTQREAFGKALTEQPVLRFKFGQMAAALEALQSFMDYVTFQMDEMYKLKRADPKFKKDYLAGEIALLKYQTTRVCNLIADNGAQLLGGRAVTRTGMGKYIERFNRCYKIYSIYGGSEEIMADLGIRQSLRDWKKEDKLVSKL